MRTKMIVSANTYPAILNYYLKQNIQFPLIISVLTKQQNGMVYWDGSHRNFFIVHHFGFCQLLALESHSAFNEWFQYFFLESMEFPQDKIRWYAVDHAWLRTINQLQSSHIAVVERMQFKYPNKVKPIFNKGTDYTVDIISEDNFDDIHSHLPIALNTRFWSSKQSFLINGFGCVGLHSNQPISICYACAVSNKLAEIDIYTHHSFRHIGIGKSVLFKFLELCSQKDITPHWDCYTNNIPSVNLAKLAGFLPYHQYSHAIISK